MRYDHDDDKNVRRFARLGFSSEIVQAHARLILCTPDLAHGSHTVCAWVAHARLILRTDCTRMSDFVQRVSTDDEFWAQIAGRGRILRVNCHQKADCVNRLRGKA